MKETLLVLFLVGTLTFGLALLGSGLGLITIPWLKFDRQVNMERGIIEKTYNADNALYNYHWFKERLEEIKATEKKIEVAEANIKSFENSLGARNTWTFDDKQEHARLVQLYSGIKSYYETIVGEYNARAKSADRAVFQDELPTFFTIKPF